MEVFEYGTVKEIEVLQVVRIRTLRSGENHNNVIADVDTYWTLDGRKVGEIDPREKPSTNKDL